MSTEMKRVWAVIVFVTIWGLVIAYIATTGRLSERHSAVPKSITKLTKETKIYLHGRDSTIKILNITVGTRLVVPGDSIIYVFEYQ